MHARARACPETRAGAGTGGASAARGRARSSRVNQWCCQTAASGAGHSKRFHPAGLASAVEGKGDTIVHKLRHALLLLLLSSRIVVVAARSRTRARVRTRARASSAAATAALAVAAANRRDVRVVGPRGGEARQEAVGHEQGAALGAGTSVAAEAAERVLQRAAQRTQERRERRNENKQQPRPPVNTRSCSENKHTTRCTEHSTKRCRARPNKLRNSQGGLPVLVQLDVPEAAAAALPRQRGEAGHAPGPLAAHRLRCEHRARSLLSEAGTRDTRRAVNRSGAQNPAEQSRRMDKQGNASRVRTWQVWHRGCRCSS
jgi:hypothetical protein